MTPFDCPRCGTALTMSERQGIEIDYCAQCRGVWLDRGELDKIIDRAAADLTRAAPPPAPAQPAGGWTQPVAAPPPAYHPDHSAPWTPRQSGWRDDDDDDRHRERYYQGRSRKHWLKELFD